MAILKCKMCGGDLRIVDGATTAECDYCGSLQTVPKVDDEKKLTLFARANRLRAACEFDKAANIYASIAAEFQEEAEAYWGVVLCKYGIEYVDDPATGKKIPTCHRSSFDSVMQDVDFEQAMENADPISRRIYRDEAKQIEELRKSIIAASSNEPPYDIFVCYKETDQNGQRTLDSVLAQDIYDALTAKGYRVFFARITLEDKLGTAYEPIIFAALHSAKIMLAVGTDYEHFNAVWVKNEWGRYLKLMEKDREKHLIPCFKGIDAYDMPTEFAKLQAQDLGKVGAMQDLLRGIEKLLPRQTESVRETVVVQQAEQLLNAAPLLKRVFIFLEDREFRRANEFCEKVLNIEPECAEAYLGKLMADLKVSNRQALGQCAEPFQTNANYQKAVRFGDKKLKAELEGYLEQIAVHKLDSAYQKACSEMNNAKTEGAFKHAAALFEEIKTYKDAEELAKKCLSYANSARLEGLYQSACGFMRTANTESAFQTASAMFAPIRGYKDAAQLEEKCMELSKIIAQRLEDERKRKIFENAKNRMKLGLTEDYEAAISLLKSIEDYDGVPALLEECHLQIKKIILQKEERALATAKKRQRRRIIVYIIAAVLLLLLLLIFLCNI